ncbi:unnamed protein product [Allacma fusca]|uniref:Uncharacterized protein n=1 Tax=Allacma fusca TaxID=39272 RepID=A0A8J2JY63_9HEXA|nr:unnamed protein product [Allacma fusca]
MCRARVPKGCNRTVFSRNKRIRCKGIFLAGDEQHIHIYHSVSFVNYAGSEFASRDIQRYPWTDAVMHC